MKQDAAHVTEAMLEDIGIAELLDGTAKFTADGVLPNMEMVICFADAVFF